MFNIISGSRTAVEVIIFCESADSGVGLFEVEVGLNICSDIDSVAIAPSQACVGETVDLVATASDRDPADAIDFLWTIDDMLFATGTTASYLCIDSVIKTVNLAVSDGKCDDIHASSFVCRDCEGDSESNSGEGSDTTSGSQAFGATGKVAINVWHRIVR